VALELLGADGLKNQYIVARIKRIDPERAKALAGESATKQALMSVALTATDRIPKAALDIGLPTTANLLKKRYGIEADLFAADAPPGKGERDISEFFPGVVVGGVAVGLVVALWSGIRRLFP
jgi:hypothetical protein